MNKTQSFVIFMLTVMCCGAFYSNFGIPTQPLDGASDLGGWEASGHYLLKYIQFVPFPLLNFETNEHFYPGGISAVYQAWGFEKDYWYALMQQIFGFGPWLQTYFLLSQIILAGGTFLLLSTRLATLPSTFLAFFVTIFNVYTFHKFPNHLAFATVHWSLLGILADALICQQLTMKRLPTLNLLLSRLVFLFGSFGLELGYVTGVGLTSLTLTILFYATLCLSSKENRARLGPQNLWVSYLKQIKMAEKITILIAVLAFVLGFLYLPLTAEIFIAVKKIESTDIVGVQGWWVKPIRFIAPFVEPYYTNLTTGIGDLAEGPLDNAVGWSYLFLFLVSCCYAVRHRSYAIMPLVILLASFVCYKPGHGRWIQYLPWFSYARVHGRLSIAYPMIIVATTLFIPFLRKGEALKKTITPFALVAIFLVILAVETPFYLKYIARDGEERNKIPAEFFNYMSEIKSLQGEAILDWPFCYKGGNGTGSCEFINLESIWANKKYHNKKVLGTYFSRLPIEYSSFYEKYGLQYLLSKQRQTCLDSQDLKTLKLFLSYHDFVGLQLYSDEVSNCTKGFHRVFGSPEKTAQFPRLGKVEFFFKA